MWVNGNRNGIDEALTRFSSFIELKAATNRNTQCYWVKIMDVYILFSYSTAMAFQSRGEGSFRRKDDISVTTRRHLRETGADDYQALEDDEFEARLDRAIVTQIVKNRSMLEGIYSAAVANNLVPERA